MIGVLGVFFVGFFGERFGFRMVVYCSVSV